MGKSISDAMFLLREAIGRVLSTATEPMTSNAVAEDVRVRELGLSTEHTSRTLKALYVTGKKPFKLKRIPAGTGRNKWEYYNPDVVQLRVIPRDVPAPAAPPVNTVNPPEFAFNPVEFDPPVEATPQVDLPVQVPAGVKSITLTIGGVSIKIDLGG